MTLHYLGGCAPAPLAHYLKALGVLRLVSEQLDPAARAFWEGERFVLTTNKTEAELIEFFLERYKPTPLVSPWNRGSGFFASDSVFLPIETSEAPRFARLRDGVRAARTHLEAIGAADQQVRSIKDETKDKHLTKTQRAELKKSEDYNRRLRAAEREFKNLKAELIPGLRLTWRGPHREWMDAALVLDGDGIARFPALLGTGGNDGRLDFTNNYFQRLAQLYDLPDLRGLPRPECRAWVEESLFGSTSMVTLAGIPVGQFLPGAAGGVNSTTGTDGGSRSNPMDFVLMLEGSILFTAAATRRWESNAPSRASAPFAVGGHSAGFASASVMEGGARGEQWVPLWSAPVTLQELSKVLAEGRAQLGAQTAREPLDLARAVARLGMSRGLQAFQRYGYIERNGQSNLAVPLGRFVVPDRTSPGLLCLDDLDVWLPRLRRQAREKGASARLMHAERSLATALFAVTQHPDEPFRWQNVLMYLADIEEIQVTGSGHAAGPIPRLGPDWVRVADDGSAEFRLAVAFALQAGAFDRRGRPLRDSGIRRHWVTLKKGRYATTGSGAQQRLLVSPDRVLLGRNGVEDAIRLVARRLVEASQVGSSRLPLQAAKRAAASAADLALLVAGEVDLDRVLRMARALMAINSSAWAHAPVPPRSAPRADVPDDAWIVVRMATYPDELPNGARVGIDPAIVRRLESGDASSAVTLALRKLRAAGIQVGLRVGTTPPEVARLWAAALAFPVNRATAAEFLARLDPKALKETAA